MIEVTLEDPDVGSLDLERCCLCRAPTAYWYAPKDVACCQACAKSATPDRLPSKKEWCDRERALTKNAYPG